METQSTDIIQQPINTEIALYNNASGLVLDETTEQKLLAPFDDKLIEIRPDGLIYLPQVFWRQRLNTSFGIGQWCLVIKNQNQDPNIKKLYVEGVLMVRGCYMATAVGEAEYHETNASQSWASVWESAKSDCITRCCKDLGIASELWQPQFITKWISENAIQVWVKDKKKPQWRRKDGKPFFGETGTAQPNAPEPKPAPPRASQAPSGEDKRTWLNPDTKNWKEAVQYLKNGGVMEQIHKHHKISKVNEFKLQDEVLNS